MSKISKKEREGRGRMRSGFLKQTTSTTVVGSVVAFGSGWLFQNNPELAKIGDTKIQSGAALGALITLLAIAGKGRARSATLGVGQGLLFPALASMGADVAREGV